MTDLEGLDHLAKLADDRWSEYVSITWLLGLLLIAACLTVAASFGVSSP